MSAAKRKDLERELRRANAAVAAAEDKLGSAWPGSKRAWLANSRWESALSYRDRIATQIAALGGAP